MIEGGTSCAELGLDFETTVGRALPARPAHALRKIVRPLQERAAVLKQALRSLQPHVIAGRMIPADEVPRCKSLLLLGSWSCMRVQGRPYFASHAVMVQQLQSLAANCTTLWQISAER